MNFKNIKIGELIRQRMEELDIDMERACSFLGLSEGEILAMYTMKDLNTYILMRWSKLLEYDFFRIYSQHLILYAPQDLNKTKRKKKKTSLPDFKKNIYTQEIIDYLMALVTSKKKTYIEIHKEYNIPKTTIMRWKNKYEKNNI